MLLICSSAVIMPDMLPSSVIHILMNMLCTVPFPHLQSLAKRVRHGPGMEKEMSLSSIQEACLVQQQLGWRKVLSLFMSDFSNST